MSSYLKIVVLLAVSTGRISAASTGVDTGSISELEAKVASLENQLKVQGLLTETQQNEQQADRLVLQKEVKDLKEALSGLQLRLQSTSEEYGALKSQFISFFRKASTLHKDSSLDDRHTDNSTAGKQPAAAELINAESEPDSDENREAITLQMTATGGVSYIRWGRTTCLGDATVLYHGFAGGKKKHTTGAAISSDIICLPYQPFPPQWDRPVSAFKDLAAIQGIEYEMGADDPFSTENLYGQPIYDHDMPCAVCHINTRSHQLMIPAIKSCPTGWTLEYWGYLVTTSKTVSGGPFLCLDKAPEAIMGGGANTNPQTVYTVEAFCTALHCPPYAQGYELTCAVCSK
jgi:hypothetical protein